MLKKYLTIFTNDLGTGTDIKRSPEHRKHFQPRQEPFHKALNVIEIFRLEGYIRAVCAQKGCKEKVADGHKTDPQ